MWIFTILDVFVLVTLFLTHYGWFVSPLMIFFSFFYLIFKGVLFFGEIMSTIDLLVAFYLVLMVFGLKTFIFYIIVFWFLYKLFFAFMD
jgi:hypothetical protein